MGGFSGPGFVGNVWAALRVDMSSLAGDIATAGATISQAGIGLSKVLTLPLLAVGVAAGKEAMNFDLTMSRITGLVGMERDVVVGMGEEILNLAPILGKAPKELAEALYYITSAGITDAAQALDILTMSGKSAAAGLGETQVVADAVTSAINAYASSGMTAAKATDILTAAVKYGKVEANEFAPTLGRVIAVGSSLGVSFADIAGTMAAMSRIGFNAAEASTSLSAVMSALLKPADKAQKAIGEAGLSFEQLRDVIKQPGGVLEVMRMLDAAFGDNEDQLATVIPNIRALRGVMNILSQDAATVDEVMQGVAASTGATEAAFKAYTDEAKSNWDSAMAGVKSTLITVGQDLLPAVSRAMYDVSQALQRFGGWWRQLSDDQQQFIIKAVAVVAALGPVLMILGQLISVLPLLGSAIKLLVGPSNPMGLFILAVTAITAGAIWLRDNWADVWSKMQSSGNPFIKGIVAAIEWISTAINNVKKAVQDVIDWFKRWKEESDKLTGAADIALGGGGTAAGKVISLGGHATGGYFTQPHIAAIAEQEPEWIVPQSQAGQFAAAMDGGAGTRALLRKLDELLNATRAVAPGVGNVINGIGR